MTRAEIERIARSAGHDLTRWEPSTIYNDVLSCRRPGCYLTVGSPPGTDRFRYAWGLQVCPAAALVHRRAPLSVRLKDEIGMIMRALYRLLSVLRWMNAIQRGPAAVARREARLQGFRFVNRLVGQGRRRRR